MSIYIKKRRFASSIVFAAAFFVLAGCDALGIPDLTRHDEVPPAVRAEPRLVGSPTADVQESGWPRLGDVPAKPKDFSPPPVYGHYMDELDYDRGEAEAARRAAEAGDQSASENNGGPTLTPPQLPKE